MTSKSRVANQQCHFRIIVPELRTHFSVFTIGEIISDDTVRGESDDSIAAADSAWAGLVKHWGKRQMMNDLETLLRENEELRRFRDKCQQLEQTINQEQGWFFRIFHASSNPMSIIALSDSRCVAVNEAFSRLSGFSREELIGHSMDALSLLADPKQKELILHKLQEDGKSPLIELNVLTKSREVLTILVSADPIMVNGESCMLAAAMDITAQKKEADALRRSEERYRMLVENSLQGVAIIQDNRFVFCNGAFVRMTGHTIEELLSKPPAELVQMIHPDDRERVRVHHEDRLAGKQIEPRCEHRGIRKDGTEFTLEVYDSPTEYNGRPATQLVCLDITEHKRSEAAVKEYGERLKLALEASGMATWDVNNQTGEVKDDAWWLSSLGYQPGEIEMNLASLNSLMHPDDLQGIQRAASDYLEGKSEHYSVEYRIRNKDGSWVWVLDRGRLVSRDSSGKPLRTMGVHLNITDHRQAMEQIRQLAGEQRAILNTISMGICYLRNRKIQWVNPAFEKMFGYEVDELKGQDTSIFYSSEEDYRLVATEGYARLAKGAIYSTEALMKRKDSILIWCSLAGQAIAKDSEEGSIWILDNITDRRQTQEALVYSEHRFRSLVETTSDLVWEVDGDGFYTYVSPKVKDLLGYDPQSVLGKRPLDFMPGDEAVRIAAIWGAITESRQSFSGLQNINLHKDGHSIVLESSGVPIWDAQGNFSGYRGIDRDITERKQAEENLRRLNRELRAISDCNQTLIRAEDEQSLLGDICRIICEKAGYRLVWVGYAENNKEKSVRPVAWAGFENGYLAQANVSWADTERGRGPVGMAIREGHSVYCQDFMRDPMFVPWREAALQRGYRSGIFFPLRDEETKIFGTLNIYSSEPHAFNADEIRLLDELAGDLAFGLSVLHARIERRRAEEALEESRAYLDQILNSLGDPLFVKNRDHEFVHVNDAFCAFDGRTRGELIGSNCFVTLPEETARVLRKRDDDAFSTGKEDTSEDAFYDHSGALHAFITKKSLLTDRSGNRQMVAVLRDITDYKRLQAQFQQSQKMEAIGILAGGVAHDFNNLLNVINGYCELLLEDFASNDSRRRDLEQISLAGKRATALTSQLLAFSRKQILQPEYLDLNSVVAGMDLMLRRLIRENIELVTIPQEGLGLINADPGQIQQVIMNLAINARDALPQGGKLSIETANVYLDQEYARAHPSVNPGAHVMLAISDNGMGMDDQTKAHLFEPFFTTKGKGKGTGLGLSTVYGIVKQSNGSIWVYSELTKGTTFKVYFPRVEDQAVPLQEKSEAEPSARGTETLLITEDDASLRALSARVLAERGYSVLQASNGKEALEISANYAGEIHLVITDVIMPGMGGKELASQIAAARPGIKVLFVSGYTDNAIVHHGVLDPGVSFLQKPFTIENLTRKVRAVLDS
jgi:PAS domain S-box-containing protein